MRAALDFRTTQRRYSPAGALLLALGLGSLALVAHRWQGVRQETQGLRWQIAARAPRSTLPQTPSPQAKQEDAARAALQRQLAVPWQPVFAAFEAATPPKIALLSIEARPRRFTLSAQARTLKGALDYVARLNHAPGLAHVLMRQYKVDEGDPAHPVRFELQGDLAP